MRWQSTAHKQSAPLRERFATPLNVVGIFLSFLFLLVLLYPEQGLLGVLSGGDDIATIRYREALLRIRPGDTDLRIRVAGSLVRSGNSRRALELLSDISTAITPAQSHVVAELRYMALKNLFAQAQAGDAEWLRLKPLVASAAVALAGTNPPAWRLRDFAADARTAGDMASWQDYSSRADVKAALENAPPDDDAAKAQMAGDYRGAAAICFELMKSAGSIDAQRALLFRAVRILQAGNFPLEAFEAGERHIDGLAYDRSTLIFLTRAGLAAGQPGRAQRLIRRALRMDAGRSQQGAS